jgi:hypothetical protein
MTALQRNERPNCDAILSEESLWSLSLYALENDYEFDRKKMEFSDDIFHSHFFEIKSRLPLDVLESIF